MRRIAPENAGIPLWKNQITIYLSSSDKGQEHLIVDTEPKRGIKEEVTQVKFGK